MPKSILLKQFYDESVNDQFSLCLRHSENQHVNEIIASLHDGFFN